jgi:hypothetical protein
MTAEFAATPTPETARDLVARIAALGIDPDAE